MGWARRAANRSGGGGEALLLAFSLLTAAVPALGAKWESCPAPPFPTYPSTLGATNSPFVHPGHELTIVLNEEELGANGGFSTEPQGNEVLVRFLSPFGPTFEMAPIRADASEASLTFMFPAAEKHGRPLVGPVEVEVLAEGRTVALIDAEDLVAVPAANDVAPLLFGSGQPAVVLGAVGADGDLWIPLRFDGPIMEKDVCPGDFIFPVSTQIAAAEIDGETGTRREPLRRIRGVTGYLGDVQVYDYSLYGMLFQNRIRLVHVGSTLGVAICQLNDALDIVMRVRGDQSWVQSETSPFGSFAGACGPVALLLYAEQVEPLKATGSFSSQVDSFDHECSPRPAQFWR